MKSKKFKASLDFNASIKCLLLLTLLVLSDWLCSSQTVYKSSASIKKTILKNIPEMTNFSTAVYQGKIFAFKYGPDHDVATNEDYQNAGSVFCYDPVTGRWEAKASMPVKKVSYRLASLNGKIYIIGGVTFKDIPGYSVEMYDPGTNEWSIKSNMPTARCRIGLAVLENKIFTFGGLAQGTETDVVEVFDPADNKWTVKSPLPDKLMGIVAIPVNGKIYYLRGVDTSWNYYYDFKEYNPNNDSWIKKSPWTFEREPDEAVVVDNRLFILGGGSVTDSTVHSVKEYDFDSDRWIFRKNIPFGMHTIHFSTIVLNSKIYIFGGGYRVNNEWRASDQALVYNTETDIWEELEPLSEGKIGMAVEAIGNKIYVIGGEIMGPSGQSSQNKFSDKIEIYEIKEP